MRGHIEGTMLGNIVLLTISYKDLTKIGEI
jgi:hypothetical protein